MSQKIQELVNNEQKVTITLDGTKGSAVLMNAAGTHQLVGINARPPSVTGIALALGGYISLSDLNGKEGTVLRHNTLTAGSPGIGGSISLVPAGAASPGLWSIHLEANGSHIRVRDANGSDSFHLDGDGAALALRGKHSQIFLGTQDTFAPTGGMIHLGADAAGGQIRMRGSDPNDPSGLAYMETILIDGQKGDIVLKNADCAEEFDVAQNDIIDPGTVVIIEDGLLRASTVEYDKRVAGVISGAGGLKAGITLDRRVSAEIRMPVALLGKTFCKVDADYAPIEAGDLLTTSATRGHAMKASDSARAFGTVFGKALKPLEKGLGLVPILVALQ